MRISAKVRLVGLLLTVALLIGLFTPGSAKPARADCTWGDIICDMQQAIQQLADQYVTPLKAWVQLQANKALYGLEYSLARTVASFLWGISKTLMTVGVGVGVLNEWIAVNFFQPMIQMTNTTMKPIIGVFLFIALCILGLSYFLAAFIRLNVVSLKSVIVWWLAGVLFFSIGPSFYLSMRVLHQALGSLFYASALNTISTQNPFSNLAAGDPALGNPVYAMSPLCSNFTPFLAGSGGSINGLDVALSFQKADGFDVVGGGIKCLGGGTALDIPRSWIAANGFFDAAKAPDSWPPMVACPPAPAVCDYDSLIQAEVADMQAAVNQSFAGIAREWQATPLAWFAIVEQLVALCLIIAQGLTFLSFACAILFAFFRRTEPVALAVIDQWLALLVQSVVIALLQGMCLALYLAAARSGSPLISMAVSVVMLVLMGILLVSGLKAIWSAFNRLFEAFGQASGGVFLSPGQAATSAAGMALTVGGAAVTGGASLMAGAANMGGAVAGGVQALGNGATWAQAAGVTLGGSKALDGAAYHLARLPGLRDTALGEAANQYVEGASVRQVGDGLLGSLPVMGGAARGLGGASLGAALLTDRNPDHAEAVVDEGGRVSWQQPMLRAAADKNITGLLSGPTWESGTSSTIGRGGLPLQEGDDTPVRKGGIPAEAAHPHNGWGRGEQFAPLAVNNDGNLDETLDADFKRDLQSDRQNNRGDDGSSQALNQAAQALSTAGGALKSSADALKQNAQDSAVQNKLPSVEGRLNVSGANNIAAVMGRAVEALAQDNKKTGQAGASSERVSAALAGVMGVSPVERDGKAIAPIEGRLNRYQLFADQALNMGLTGADSAQALREVKANPEGRLLPATRDRLIRQQHEERGEAWADSVQQVQALEHAARIVPASISVYGSRAMDIPPSIAAAGEPIRLSPANASSSGAVIFTPTPSPAPTVIISAAPAPPAPTVILIPNQDRQSSARSASVSPTSDAAPALDGMRGTDKSLMPDHENDASDTYKDNAE